MPPGAKVCSAQEAGLSVSGHTADFIDGKTRHNGTWVFQQILCGGFS